VDLENFFFSRKNFPEIPRQNDQVIRILSQQFGHGSILSKSFILSTATREHFTGSFLIDRKGAEFDGYLP